MSAAEFLGVVRSLDPIPPPVPPELRASGMRSRIARVFRPTEHRELELLARLSCGDASAFEAVVRENQPRMLAAARRLLRDDEESRDVVQEAWLCALRALPCFAGEARLATWLHRIVVNAALMKLRSRRRRPEVVIEPGADVLAEAISTNEESSAESSMERAALCARVRRAVAALPESQRVVVELRDLEGLDTTQTAVRLDISREAVKTRLHRAHQSLKRLLEAQGEVALAHCPEGAAS